MGIRKGPGTLGVERAQKHERDDAVARLVEEVRARETAVEREDLDTETGASASR